MYAYLSRRTNGQYLLTKTLPVVAHILGANPPQLDVYARPGDPLNISVCQWAVVHIWGLPKPLDCLTTIRIHLPETTLAGEAKLLPLPKEIVG